MALTFTFSPLLTETVLDFMKRYPGVRLNIIYKTMAELMDMLQRHEVDFVLAFKPTEKNERVESYVLFNNKLVAAMSVTHPLAKRKSITIDDLKDCQVAMPAHGLQNRNAFENIAEQSAKKYQYTVRNKRYKYSAKTGATEQTCNSSCRSCFTQ